MRYLIAALTYAVTLAVTAVVAFFAIIFLAGPHGGALPLWLHTPVVLAGLVCVLAVPALVTRAVWRRFR